jgi:16S rRNA processing protein RimM
LRLLNSSGTTTISHTAASGEFITLARVVKTQGRWGEVAAEIHSDVPERFAEGMKLLALLESPGRSPGKSAGAKTVEEQTGEIRREVEVESLWPHKELLVLKFIGVDSISEAEVLVGSELQVPIGDRAHLDAGWNYVSDLVGCSVYDHGKEIGHVEDVQFGAGEAPLLIVVNTAGKKFDVPFADAYLDSVDSARRQVRMKLPEGLLDVNAPLSAEEKAEQARLQHESSGNNRGHKDATMTKNPRRSSDENEKV